jgi:ribosomal protein S18 acetylase RimI-like enzyme
LLLHAFQVFKQRGEPYVDLKVLETNLRARRLYESAGMLFVMRDVVSEE